MRVLVTGAAGFIGSNLVAELRRRDHEVIGLDDLSHGFELNVEDFEADEGFELVHGDVRDERIVRDAAEGCEVIVHLAARKIPRYTDAYETLMVNGLGSEVIAQVAARINAKVVAASTSDVYGKSPAIPFSEETDSVIGAPTVKRWAYAISKMFEEQLLLACHERFGIDVVLLRFFGGYGPNQNLTWWGGPQSVFINKALDDELIPIHGDGRQTRSFTYVSDHVEGIAAAVESRAANNEVLNLGNTREISIADLAHMIWHMVRGEDSEPKVEIVPYETFGKYEDVMRRVPDIGKARQLLGFTPRVHLEEGLPRTIEWQVERRRRFAEEGIAGP